jgi:hypothetical protein
MRLFLMIPILAVALQADPITVVETQSGVGLITLFDSYSVPDSPGAVTALIEDEASCPFNPGCAQGQSVAATIDLSMDLYTPGPIRDGVALVQLFLSSDGDAGGGAHVSGAVGPYSLGGCAKGLECSIFGYFPFELGIPFTIDLSGFADGEAPFGGAGVFASASLQLYELPTQGTDPAGAPVQIYVVPEPGSAGLAFIGLSAFMLFAVCRKRALPSKAH